LNEKAIELQRTIVALQRSLDDYGDLEELKVIYALVFYEYGGLAFCLGELRGTRTATSTGDRGVSG